MNSDAQKIEGAIKAMKKGSLFFADDFVGLGSSESIRQTLLRLAKSGVIIRVAQGIYCFPEVDETLGLGVLKPSYEQIAEALAQRSHARIVPTGDYALNKLGLSTQVPMNFVYLTDGPSRKVDIANGRGITFKKTAPRNLSFTNKLAMLITSALKSIGRLNVNEFQLKRIKELLKHEDKEAVYADLKLMPVWIRNIMTESYE